MVDTLVLDGRVLVNGNGLSPTLSRSASCLSNPVRSNKNEEHIFEVARALADAP